MRKKRKKNHQANKLKKKAPPNLRKPSDFITNNFEFKTLIGKFLFVFIYSNIFQTIF
jgi:hypothetical protein